MFGIVKGRLTEAYNDYAFPRPAYRYVDKVVTGKNGDPEKVRVPELIKGKFVIHKGLDIGNGDGLSWPVYCPCLVGIVVHIYKYYKDESFWPTQVIIEDGKNPGYFHRLGHLDHRLKVHLGEVVFLGTPIGATASTETLRRIDRKSSMRSHLHYEIFSDCVITKNRFGQSEITKSPDWPQDYCDPFAYLKNNQLSHGKAHAVARLYEEKIR